jgi:simple sugar transport system substrate-binding protein
VLHVSTDESVAGMAAGRQLAALGVTNGLCLTVEVGEPAGVRCSGAATALARNRGVMDVLTALDPWGDPSGIRGALAARLRTDPTIDGILMTDAASTSQALSAVKDAGRLASITLGTFDPGTDALDALEAGELTFAIEQQPFLQGYLALMSLALYVLDGLLPGGGGPVTVGPVVVTRQEATRVRELVRQGIR